MLVLLLASTCASATSRAARPLEIRSDGGRILACVPLDEGEDVAVEAAGVSAVRVGGQDLPKPWRITIDKGHSMLRLEPGDCLAYGADLDGYVRAPLEVELGNDLPYYFAIRSPEWGKHGTRNHSGMFCVRRRAGTLVAVTVPRRSDVVTPATCVRLLDAAEGP